MSVLRKRPTREVENENEDDDEESLEQHICPTCRADLGGSSFSSCCFSSRLPHSSAHSKMCFTSFSFSVDDIFKAEAQVIKPAHFRKARPRVNQLPSLHSSFSDTVPSPTFAPSSSLGVVVPSTKMLRMHELVEEWLLEDPDAKVSSSSLQHPLIANICPFFVAQDHHLLSMDAIPRTHL